MSYFLVCCQEVKEMCLEAEARAEKAREEAELKLLSERKLREVRLPI